MDAILDFISHMLFTTIDQKIIEDKSSIIKRRTKRIILLLSYLCILFVGSWLLYKYL